MINLYVIIQGLVMLIITILLIMLGWSLIWHFFLKKITLIQELLELNKNKNIRKEPKYIPSAIKLEDRNK